MASDPISFARTERGSADELLLMEAGFESCGGDKMVAGKIRSARA